MSLTLHFHPLASFCWKVLIALYETETPFESIIVDLGEETLTGGVPEAVAGRQDAGADRHGARHDVPESDHHHRISRNLLSGPQRTHSGRSWTWPAARGSPTASTTSTCTSRCRRSSATGCGLQGSKDPFGVEQARATLGDRLRHDRRGHGLEALGDGRGLHAGRLRRVSRALLRQQGRAFPRQLRQPRPLSRAADASARPCSACCAKPSPISRCSRHSEEA